MATSSLRWLFAVLVPLTTLLSFQLQRPSVNSVVKILVCQRTYAAVLMLFVFIRRGHVYCCRLKSLTSFQVDRPGSCWMVFFEEMEKLQMWTLFAYSILRY
jgi:hypothetical protein